MQKLKTGEIAVICGFSESCCIIQDEVKGFLWNNVQATVHQLMAYFSENKRQTTSVMLLSRIV
jgi:hypothetical protein